MPAVGSAILLALIAGFIWLVVHLRSWERREQRLNAGPELVTYFVVLAPGIKDAPEQWAKGHEKAGEDLRGYGVETGYMARLEKRGDTTATITPTLRCMAENAPFVQSCYTTYIPEGHLGFIPVPPKEDPYALAHVAVVSAREHGGPDRMREWLLLRLRRRHLA